MTESEKALLDFTAVSIQALQKDLMAVLRKHQDNEDMLEAWTLMEQAVIALRSCENARNS